MSESCLVAVLALACALGCGDNSKECGPGTADERGLCVPTTECGLGTKLDDEIGECVPDGSVVCSDGTVFDPLTGRCKIDPAACQNGTVLVNNKCVDPTAALTIDVEEGPEPNGLGIIEASDAQAGNVALKAVGEAFVIHGTLAPWRDANNDGALDPDVDTFVVTIATPALLRVTADGVGGTTAGFAMIAAVDTADPLVAWRRYGVNLAGDTSERQVYLPAPATYRIAIADTRSLGEYIETGSATAAPAGGEYYVSVTDLGAPTLTTLTSNTVNATLDSKTLAFYASTPGTGITEATVTMPSELARASVVAMVNGTFRVFADETSQPATVMLGALQSGDTTFVVVDYVFHTMPSPAAFTLAVNTTNL